MIHSRAELKRYIIEDNREFFSKSLKERMISFFCRYPDYEIMLFKRCLRKAEYAFNTVNRSKIKFLRALFYERRKNKIGKQLGIEIDINCFGAGLEIYHGGNIIVNPQARIGKNCKLHGGNCIGNNGITKAVPIIGDNVDIGFGACIIGDVELADNIIIGSNAVVVKSCVRQGAVLVGMPAKEIR